MEGTCKSSVCIRNITRLHVYKIQRFTACLAVLPSESHKSIWLMWGCRGDWYSQWRSEHRKKEIFKMQSRYLVICVGNTACSISHLCSNYSYLPASVQLFWPFSMLDATFDNQLIFKGDKIMSIKTSIKQLTRVCDIIRHSNHGDTIPLKLHVSYSVE